MPSAPLSPDDAQYPHLAGRLAGQLDAPLDAIRGMTAMLLNSGLTEEQSRYARSIEASTRTLHDFAARLSDYSKLLDGLQVLQNADFSLPDLVAEILAALREKAEARSLPIKHFISADTPSILHGDSTRLRQLITHLLDNAINHTTAGEIRLDIRPEIPSSASPDPRNSLLRFTIIDTGSGIPPAISQAIFEPLGAGSGFGLAISRQIARLMGGDLHVHSIPGQGATFWFTAYLGQNDAPQPQDSTESSAPGIAPLRILIADDNAINQIVLRDQLEKLGHHCAIVHNGVEVLEAMENENWDVLMLDCQMPIMDGYQTVRAIRRAESAEGETAGHTWVIGVTAGIADGERERCIEAGMDDFLTKPIVSRDLARAIARIPHVMGETATDRFPIDPAQLANLAKSKASSGENLLDRMIKLFTESGPRMLDQMDTALREGDLATAGRCAHKLAGGCSYFGALDLYSLCSDFERLSRAGNHAASRSLAPFIRQEYARVEVAIERNRTTAPASP